jgi:hypothetical protein
MKCPRSKHNNNINNHNLVCIKIRFITSFKQTKYYWQCLKVTFFSHIYSLI